VQSVLAPLLEFAIFENVVTLKAECELEDRTRTIERKLEMLGESAEWLLDLVQDKRSLRLELPVIGPIVFKVASASPRSRLDGQTNAGIIHHAGHHRASAECQLLTRADVQRSE